MDKKIIDKSFKAAHLEFKEEPMDKNYSNLVVGLVSRGRVKKIIKEAGNLKRKNVVEVGCEAGYVSIQLAKKGANVTSFDICEPALRLFQKKIKNSKLKSNVDIFMAMVQSTPLKNNSFDIVICTEVIEHAPYLEKSLFEMNRILKPNGRLIITFPNEKLRKKIYPIAKLAGVNVAVEDEVTLFSYTLKDIIKKLRKIMKIEKVYSWPKLFPVTRFVVCRK